MFSFFVFYSQWYCLIKKKKKILSLSSELSSHYPFPLSHQCSSWCQSLSRSRLMCLSVGFAVVTWASDLSSRWCLGFTINFVVVLGFVNLRPISLSPNVVRDGTDPSLSRWRFVGLWWPVVGFCWSCGWVLLVCGGSCNGSRCDYRWVCCCDCWFCWWMVASSGCRWLCLSVVVVEVGIDSKKIIILRIIK